MREIIVVRGGGDIATGTIQALRRGGFGAVVTECARPSSIRRAVCLSEAVYLGSCTVEDMDAELSGSPAETARLLESGKIPVLVDEAAGCVRELQPAAVVDAILAKRNLGTEKWMAPVTVGLGPGFRAPEDVDAVIETMRGHDLGRIILNGSALPDTGTPGEIAGVGADRLLRAPADGVIRLTADIGDLVRRGDILADVGGAPLTADIDGVLRGLIHDGCAVRRGMKVGDIDPRAAERRNCFTISDKARCIGGAVLAAVLMLMAGSGR